LSEGRKTIDERIRELKEEGLSREEMARILYEEGYPTRELMKRCLPPGGTLRREALEETAIKKLLWKELTEKRELPLMFALFTYSHLNEFLKWFHSLKLRGVKAVDSNIR